MVPDEPANWTVTWAAHVCLDPACGIPYVGAVTEIHPGIDGLREVHGL